MKIHTLFNQERPVFSMEIFPPKKTSAIEEIYKTLDQLVSVNPDFISVTYGAGGGKAGQQTCDLAAHIKNNLHVEPLAHMTCVNSSKEEVLKNLERLKEKNIENVLALRGDRVEGAIMNPQFSHANELAVLIHRYSNMNIAGACYPEGHAECSSLEKDIENLKYKIEAGVEHLITQLFFDNEKFYVFMDKLRNSGICIPVEAGIMPIVTTRQLERTVALSGASLPVDFTRMVSRYGQNPESLHKAGIEYAVEQIKDLLYHGVEGIHLYTMNNARVAEEIYEGVKTELGR